MTVKELLRMLEDLPSDQRNKPIAFLVFRDPLDARNTTELAPKVLRPIHEVNLGRAYVGVDGRPHHFPTGDQDVIAVAVCEWDSKQ